MEPTPLDSLTCILQSLSGPHAIEAGWERTGGGEWLWRGFCDTIAPYWDNNSFAEGAAELPKMAVARCQGQKHTCYLIPWGQSLVITLSFLAVLGHWPCDIQHICGYSSPFCKMEHLHSVECFNISGLSTTLHTSERYVITLILHCLSNHPGRKEGVLDVVYAPLFSPQITDLKKFQFPRKSHAGEREI